MSIHTLIKKMKILIKALTHWNIADVLGPQMPLAGPAFMAVDSRIELAEATHFIALIDAVAGAPSIRAEVDSKSMSSSSVAWMTRSKERTSEWASLLLPLPTSAMMLFIKTSASVALPPSR